VTTIPATPEYDVDRKRIYVPSGEGFMYCYRQIDADHYEREAKIPTAIGARTSSYSEARNSGSTKPATD
jgi:hypothetical protein